jgi:ribosomal protein S18 acetylase RimI-like enzyme
LIAPGSFVAGKLNYNVEIAARMHQPTRLNIGVPLIIRDAVVQDRVEVHGILNQCASWLATQGLKHWEGFHTEAWVDRALETLRVRLVEHEGPVGLIMSRPGIPEDFKRWDSHPVNQQANSGLLKHLWISKLAVLPTRHGEGIGSALLKDAESLSMNGTAFDVVRLDAVKSYPQLRIFYEGRGYTIIGEHHDCYVYEKILPNRP